MLALLTAFVVSLGVTLFVVHFARGHRHFFLDHDLSGPQKFHAHPVPRVGGLGIFVGLLMVAVGLIIGWRRSGMSAQLPPTGWRR